MNLLLETGFLNMTLKQRLKKVLSEAEEVTDLATATVEFIGNNSEYFGSVLEVTPIPGGAFVEFSFDLSNPLASKGSAEVSFISRDKTKILIHSLKVDDDVLIEEEELYLKDIEGILKDHLNTKEFEDVSDFEDTEDSDVEDTEDSDVDDSDVEDSDIDNFQT